MSRLAVTKTWKLFIDGKFPRTESGRTLQAVGPGGAHLAHYCRASKKDLRDAVVAARKAAGGWGGITAYLRSQILYRLAEMLETRSAALTEELRLCGMTEAAARAEVAAACDLLVHVAGWPDKLPQVFGSVNPVAAPYFNFSALEPMGVVVAFAPDAPALLASVALIATVIAGGNTCILIASDKHPLPAMALAEAVAVSDVPAGVVNILTGQRGELAQPAADHRDIDAIADAAEDAALSATLRAGAAVNLKRVITWPAGTKWSDADAAAGGHRIVEFCETKTTWHPVGV